MIDVTIPSIPKPKGRPPKKYLEVKNMAEDDLPPTPPKKPQYKSKIDTDEAFRKDLLAKNQRNVRQWRSVLIKFARHSKRLTQQQVADRLNIFQSSYSLIEKNGTQSRHLKKLATILGVPRKLLLSPTVDEFKEYIREVSDKNVRYNLPQYTDCRGDSSILLVLSPHEVHLILNGLAVLNNRYRRPERIKEVNQLYEAIEIEYQKSIVIV